MRILVVDDDRSVRTAIETLLRRQGHVVVVADSGESGARAFETSEFDAVLVDIFMPGLNGLETIRTLRERSPTTPIVAMSGFRFFSSHLGSAPDFLGMALMLGATYCLPKPFRPEQLAAAIDSCIAERSTPLREPDAPPTDNPWANVTASASSG